MNMQALKGISRRNWLIIIGCATVVLGGVAVWLLMGALTRLGPDDGVPAMIRRDGDGSSLFQQIAERNVQIDEQRRVAAQFEEKRKILEGMKADIAVARKRLPTEAQKAEMRQLIGDLARQVGSAVGALTVSSVSIRETAPTGRGGNPYATVEYQTTVQADMDGLIQFINLIESHQRFMTVDGIQLSSGGISVEPDGKILPKQHAVTLRIVTYVDTSGGATAGKR